MASLGLKERDFISHFGHLCRRKDLMILFGATKWQIDKAKRELDATIKDPSKYKGRKLHFKQMKYMFENNLEDISAAADIRSRKKTVEQNSRRIWTEIEDSYLLDNYGFKDTSEIALYLNRTIPAIHQRALKLLVKVFENVGKMPLLLVARRYRISKTTLYRWIDKGILESEKIGAFNYITLGALNKVVREKKPDTLFYCTGCLRVHLLGTVICTEEVCR